MKPEELVVSLDVAKKLKEAGFPQEGSAFYWVKGETQVFLESARVPPSKDCEYFAAPTCS